MNCNPTKASKRVEDITQTAGYKKAMDDVKHGRVTEYASLKDFYKDIMCEVSAK